MSERVAALWPEIVLFVTVTIAILVGTSADRDFRRASTGVAALGLFIAFVFAAMTPAVPGPLPGLAALAKPIIAGLGLLLLLATGQVDREIEAALESGRTAWSPLAVRRGEFVAFFLLSLTGAMLCTTATDLIWLFLALELTSLPTYVMVATSREEGEAREAAVKYFFLGAMASAVMLYGFALLYGATGSLHLLDIRDTLALQAASEAGISVLAGLGLVLAVLGLAYKIAAFPMQFYVADVYDGADTSVSAFLAFVPKTAGFIALLVLLAVLPSAASIGLAGDSLAFPPALHATLWIVAAMTMTIGNGLALWQNRIKRVLAYSSVAHSGYLVIGLLAGPGRADAQGTAGFASVVFYLLFYGIATIGAFMVTGSLVRNEREIEEVEDLAGIGGRNPWTSAALTLCLLSLMGLPPIAGFFAKLHLFATGMSAGEYALVVIAGLNSAVGAYYYLRLAALPWIGTPRPTSTDPDGDAPVVAGPLRGRGLAAFVAALGVVLLVFLGSPVLDAAVRATRPADPPPAPVIEFRPGDATTNDTADKGQG